MSELIRINVPRENANDIEFKILKLPFSSGSQVEKDDVIAHLESSKMVLELESPSDGYLFYPYESEEMVPVGGLFGVISQSSTLPDSFTWPQKNQQTGSQDTTSGSQRFSRKALERIERENIPRDWFDHLPLVREKDVDEVMQQKHSAVEHDSIDPLPANDKPSLLFIGGGGMAKMAIDLVRQTEEFNIRGIADSILTPGTDVMGIPVLGNDSKKSLQHYFDSGFTHAAVTISALNQPGVRLNIYERLRSVGFQLPNLVHPKALVEPSVQLGQGNLILSGVIVGTEARIGNLNILNTGSIVSHDCLLGDNVHLTPGAILAGRVKVGNSTIIGMGATVYKDVRIGENIVIRNGANVFADLKGNPAVRN